MIRSSPNRDQNSWTPAHKLASLQRGTGSAPDGTAEAAPNVGADDGIQDWDDLFQVMRASLGEAGDEPLDLPLERWPAGKPPRLSPALLQCVAALHRLHPAVLRRLDRQAQIERELVDAHRTLAQVRGDLIGAGNVPPQASGNATTLQRDRDVVCERLDRSLAGAAAGRAALVVVHLDRTAIESTDRAVGRGAGAALVGLVASRLRLVVQPGDAVCRIADGDFACLLVDAGNREELILTAWKLFDAAGSPVALGDREVSVRPSLGITVASADAATAAVMLPQAEQAARRAGQRMSSYEFFDAHTPGGDA